MKTKIMGLLILTILILNGCLMNPEDTEKCAEDLRDGKMDDGWNCATIPSRCFLDCEEFEAKFFKFDSGAFQSDECWCIKDREPLQIY